MDADKFLDAASSPEEWFAKARELRRFGDTMWDQFLRCFQSQTWPSGNPVKPQDLAVLDEAVSYLVASQMFYGLALETALKGVILRDEPEAVCFRITADGNRRLSSASIDQFGVKINEGHNLAKLAEKAGAFRRDVECPLFENESDFRAFREVLLRLSEVVQWEFRYPVPLRSDMGHTPPEDLPSRIFGHYVRDWVDPALDKLIGPALTTVLPPAVTPCPSTASLSPEKDDHH